MVRLLRDQIIKLALEPEIELGVHSVLLTTKDGQKIHGYVHDFEYLDAEVKAHEIVTIQVLDC